jgi:hypothetical protein
MTELHFCNVCQQSVPQIKLDTGDAVRHGKRIICPDCADTLVIATELEPAKNEWTLSPIIIAMFMITWAASAYVYVEQKKSITDMTAAQEGLQAENDRQSAILSEYKTSFLTLGSDFREAERGLEGLEAKVVKTENSLRGALNRQAKELASFDDLPIELQALSTQFGLAQAELASVGESARVIRQGQQGLRDRITEFERELEAAPAPVDVTSDTFSSNVRDILNSLQDSDPNTRFSALEEIANQNDPNLVPYVVPLLEDSYEFCRYQAATTLRQWSALSATPQLIEALEDSFEFVRKEVNAALEEITKASVGYNHKDEKAARASSQQAWRDWWQNNG